MRYCLKLSYKGTKYHGWQKQKNAMSVQQLIDESLSLLLKDNIETTGCGRTDAGVHAIEFFAHFDSESDFDNRDLVYRLNQFLPFDIAIHDIFKVKPEFNARFDAKFREYEYRICQNRDPFLTDVCWQNYRNFDLDKMNNSCKILFEYTDFESFSKVKTDVKTFECKIMSANWEKRDEIIVFTIRADRFLRNMVRAIVGTMLEIGLDEINEQDFRNIIENKNRSEAGHSVPAKGLFLTKVGYDFLVVLQ